MLYVASPVLVDAWRIVSVEPAAADEQAPVRHLTTEDGVKRVATAEMCARYIPEPGDFWVKQADGYEYINPKAVFERKYTPRSKKSA